MPAHHHAAAILSVGDELVLGQTLDTNSAWISARLCDRGVPVGMHATVPDQERSIRSWIVELADVYGLVIVTGGLGPTQDDLTRQALAGALGEELVCDEAALEQIRQRFLFANMVMPASNAIQACHPTSARLLSNGFGTAPGLHATIGGSDVFCLPGPPEEMHPMFTAEVEPMLRPAKSVITQLVRTVGLTESAVADRLVTLIDRRRNPLVGTTASAGSVTCRIRYEGDDPILGERLVAETVDSVREALGPYAFGVGTSDLPGVVVDLLRGTGSTITTVESCTGGLIGKMITDVAGSSDVYVGGWMTYSNSFKAEHVGVDPAVLESHGAVSEPCCRQMAEGGLTRSGADYALSVTGIAGPGGGSAEKPVGTVWIGLAPRNGPTQTRRFRFNGDRSAIRTRSAMMALAMLRLVLIGASEATLTGEDVG